MFISDNKRIKLKLSYDSRKRETQMKIYKEWLKRNNVKYSIMYNADCTYIPEYIHMRNEDAIIFQLVFSL